MVVTSSTVIFSQMSKSSPDEILGGVDDCVTGLRDVVPVESPLFV